MFTDMVGYTALTQANESQAMRVLARHNELLRPIFPKYNGREVKTIGDSFLVEFESALDAAKCAVEIQATLHGYNASSKNEGEIRLRIGIHLGDVIHQGGDVFGDAVNIASRIEPIAEPEGICISQQVYDQVGNKLERPLVKLATKEMKNVKVPIDVYKVAMPWEEETEMPPESLDAMRIAVLPFSNMSPDPNDAYFADGMTEELITSLSGIKELTVIARTSVMKYKQGVKGVDEIGRELNAGTIVEGSVRKAGDRIRVTVQLVNSNTEGHLWAESYDRKLDDVFTVQSDIAQRVADSMKVKLLAGEKASITKIPTKNMPAYESYLRGKSLIYRGSGVEVYRDSIRYFEEAIRLDPEFSAAYAELGNVYVTLAGETVAPREAFAKAEPLVAKAIELDEANSDAHLAKGNLALQYSIDFDVAGREFRRAIELNPSNMPAHLWYATYWNTAGDFDRALKEAAVARELDPLSMRPRYVITVIYFVKRDYETALVHAKEDAELEPENPGNRLTLSALYFLTGKREMAEKELQTALGFRIRKYDRESVGWTMAALGHEEEARRILREIEADKETPYLSATFRAGIYSMLGEKEKAIALLEQDFADSPTTFLFRFRNPLYDPLRDDPRFVSMVKKLNLPETSRLAG
jgi:TolB-like protein/tetratricopeptide (TPR) repeat protein